MCFAVGGDHDDFVDAFVYANLEKERHFVDNHSMGFPCGDSAHEALLLAGDAGMDDALELSTFPSDHGRRCFRVLVGRASDPV